MQHEASFHDGYMRALQDLEKLLTTLTIDDSARVVELRHEIELRIEKARCLSRSVLAACATGDAGY